MKKHQVQFNALSHDEQKTGWVWEDQNSNTETTISKYYFNSP